MSIVIGYWLSQCGRSGGRINYRHPDIGTGVPRDRDSFSITFSRLIGGAAAADTFIGGGAAAVASAAEATLYFLGTHLTGLLSKGPPQGKKCVIGENDVSSSRTFLIVLYANFFQKSPIQLGSD